MAKVTTNKKKRKQLNFGEILTEKLFHMTNQKTINEIDG